MPDTTRRRRRRAQCDDPSARLAAELSSIVELVADAAARAGWGEPAKLARIISDRTEGFELGLLPIDSMGGPAGALVGFRAPQEWLALGVVTEGDAHHVDDLLHRAAPAGRARVVHLVHRGGRSASSLCREGEAPEVSAEPVRGRIDDLLRRALELPTPPPDTSVLELLALAWLDRTMLHLAHAPAPPTFAELAHLHPAVALAIDQPRDAAASTVVGELVAVANAVGERLGWEALRVQSATGSGSIAGVDAHLASWLDAGSFSRWALGAWPLLGELFDAVVTHVPTPVASDIAAALAAWGLDGRALRL